MDKFKVIIAGSREYTDYAQLSESCLFFLQNKAWETIEIVSGCARGADRLGEKFADEFGIPVTLFPADWEQHGRSAGFRRNEQMARYANALIAFPIGASRGTRDMIRRARAHGLAVRYGTNRKATL